MPYAYRKNERIRKNNQFVSVMKGKRLSIDGLSLFYAPNDVAHFRVGISVGKKIANAVRRNRIRRQIRACVMKTLQDVSLGYDLVFVVRRELASADFPRILSAVEAALRRTALRSIKHEGTAT